MVVVTKNPKKSSKNTTAKAEEIVLKSEDTGDVLAKYDEEMVQALIDTVAPSANRSELIMMLSVANKYGLDPFRKEIWFTKIKNKPVIMTGRDGYVKIAKQNPAFEKLQSVAVYENDEFTVEYENGELKSFTHKYGMNDRGKCIGAWASLKYHGIDPIFITVQTDEYDQEQSVWKTHKSAMIRKVAEKEVCRLGEGVTGIYIEEEMPEEYSLENTLNPKKPVFKNVKQENNKENDVIDIKKIDGDDLE